MPHKQEGEFREPNMLLGMDLDKVKQTLDRIAEQLDEHKNNKNPYIWLSIDFDKVKQRIDDITAQIEEVQRKFQSDWPYNKD